VLRTAWSHALFGVVTTQVANPKTFGPKSYIVAQVAERKGRMTGSTTNRPGLDVCPRYLSGVDHEPPCGQIRACNIIDPQGLIALKSLSPRQRHLTPFTSISIIRLIIDIRF
jgi:hypothetical protein